MKNTNFRDKLYQQTFQAFLICQMHIVEEAYYPSHHSQQREANKSTYFQCQKKLMVPISYRKGSLWLYAFMLFYLE